MELGSPGHGGMNEDQGRPPRLWEWGIVVVPFLLLVAWHFGDLPSRQAGDYAQYMLHARAIAEGRPYAETGYLYSPHAALIAPPVQPPGWPLLLVPAVALFGTGLLVPKLMVIAAGVAFLVMVMRRMSRRDDPVVLSVAIGGAGLALETTYATNSPLSDLPFCALLWGVVLLADSREALSWKRAALVGALTGYTILTRIAGVAILPALVLLALVRPRDRRVLLALVGVFALAGVLGVVVVGADRVPFLSQLLRSPEILLARMSTFGAKYRLPFFEATMYPFPWDLANDAYHLAALVIAPFGFLAFFKRYGRSMLGCLVVAYATMILLAPVADARYLWPFWPVLLYAVVAGARTVLRRIPPVSRLAPRLALALGLVVVTGGFARAVRTPSPEGLLRDPAVQDLFGWLRRAPERETMRVVFVRARVLTLETGIPAMGVFSATDSVLHAEFARHRITHVITGDAKIGLAGSSAIDRVIAGSPQRFSPVYTNEAFRVYRYQAAP